MLKDYKGSAVIAQGEAFEATPANIQIRLQSSVIEGVKLNLVPKKNRGEAVFAQMTFNMGNEDSLQGKGTAARCTASMLNKETKSKTRQHIQDHTNRCKSGLFPVFQGVHHGDLGVFTHKLPLLSDDGPPIFP
jgi:zinc protease